MESTSIQRSTLVTVVAWFLIVLGGFGTLMGILQNVFIHLALPADTFQIPLEAEQTKQIPEFAKFMITNISVVFAIFVIIPLLMFSSGIGLLKRKNWARLTVITIMWLGVVWNLVSLAAQFIFFSQVPMSIPENVSAQLQSQIDSMESMRQTMAIVSAVFALAISVLFAWIALRLSSPNIKAEFGALSSIPYKDE